MQYCTKAVPFELKSAEPDGSQFTGYAACYNSVDAYRHILEPGCLKDSLHDFLHKDGFIGGMNHNHSQPIGKPIDVKEDANGLIITGSVVDTNHGKDVKILLKEGVVRKLSIGFYINAWERLEDADAVDNYWQSKGYTPSAQDKAMVQYGALLVKKGTLKETSPVMIPANGGADIFGVKADDPMTALSQLEQISTTLKMLAQSPAGKDLWKMASPLLEEVRVTLVSLAADPDQPARELQLMHLKAMGQNARLQKLLVGV